MYLCERSAHNTGSWTRELARSDKISIWSTLCPIPWNLICLPYTPCRPPWLDARLWFLQQSSTGFWCPQRGIYRWSVDDVMCLAGLSRPLTSSKVRVRLDWFIYMSLAMTQFPVGCLTQLSVNKDPGLENNYNFSQQLLRVHTPVTNQESSSCDDLILSNDK